KNTTVLPTAIYFFAKKLFLLGLKSHHDELPPQRSARPQSQYDNSLLLPTIQILHFKYKQRLINLGLFLAVITGKQKGKARWII
ncbi:MAG: hypothetical protein KDE62_07080, partial [Calditrichaeota bacterium]|nr:hypothetical protein [Calditrichota bacterium]